MVVVRTVVVVAVMDNSMVITMVIVDRSIVHDQAQLIVMKGDHRDHQVVVMIV